MSGPGEHTRVDVVVVSYHNQRTLRSCVAAMAHQAGVAVVVVDNASPDGDGETVADLPVDVVRASRNGGFAYGCNLGAARGSAPYLLLLNPDARIGAADLAALVEALERDP